VVVATARWVASGFCSLSVRPVCREFKSAQLKLNLSVRRVVSVVRCRSALVVHLVAINHRYAFTNPL
jgi:hypothetical protein